MTSSLLIKSLLGNINLVLQVPELANQQLSLPGLIVAENLGVIQLSGQSSLGLGQHVEAVLQVSDNAEQLSVLIGNLVLGHGEVSKSEVGSINLLVDGIKLLNQGLVGLVSRGLASHDLLSGSSGIIHLSHDGLLVLLNLGLHLLEGIDLLLHLQSGVALLPLQVAEDRLGGNVGLLHILAQLDDLSLALLVELHLGHGGTAGLVVPVTELLDLTGEVRSLALSLGAGLALGLQLLLSALNTGLQLLDVLLGLGYQRLLVIQLGGQHVDILLLGSNDVLNVIPLPLKIVDSVLSHLQVSLNLPLLLLKIGSCLLLLVKSSLQLVMSGLELRLDLVQVSNLLLGSNQILSGLGLGGGQMLLLLVELVDDLILLSNLVLEHLDGVVPVALLLLHLGDGKLHILNVLLDCSNAARVSLDLSSKLDSGCLLSFHDVSLSSKFHLSLSLQLISLGLSVGVLRDAALLLGKLLGHGANLSLQVIHLALKLSGLVQSCLVLTVGFIGLLLQQPELLLGIRQTNHGPGLLDDDKPSPVPHLQILPEVPLANLDQLSLVSLASINPASDPLQHLTLDEAHPFDDEVITSLLKLGKRSGSEEDKGVSQPVSLPVESNLVHESIGGGLVVAGAGNLSLSQASISHLVVGIEHTVRESTHADPDTLQHTVTGQLVHNQRRLHISGLLVGVGHKAADKVGSAVVEGGHQLSQRDEVERGHGLATASLLLLLAVILGGSSGLSGVVSPEQNQEFALGGGLHDFDNSVVDRVLVLLQPASHVVVDNTGVVRDAKVSILVSLGGGLQEHRQLAKGSLQLLLKGLVSGFGEEGLLLENGPDTHGLLEHDDSSGKIHTKVHHDPVNTLLDVFLLLNNKHVVVEELLQLLVDKVDGNLLEAVLLENLETSNVEHSAEVGLLEGGINEGVITLDDEPLEHAVKDGTGNTAGGHGSLLHSLTLGHPLGADLDAGLAEGLEQRHGLNSAESGHLAGEGFRSNALHLSLVVTTLLDVDNTSSSHDSGSQHVAVKLLLGREAKHIEGVLSVLQLLIVINGGDSGLALGDIDVVVDVGGQLALVPQTLGADTITIWLDQLVEDVVGSLDLLLLSDTRLLKQIGHDVATSQLARGSKVDTDEFTETGGVVIPSSLGISVGLQNGVGGHNLVLKGDLLIRLLAARASGDHGKIGDDLLGVLSLAGTRLSGDQHGVVLLVGQHVPVGALGNGPQMGWDLITPLAKVDLAHSVGVQRITLVGVDNNHEETRVGMDHLGLVAGLQVPEDGSVIEEGQVDHVLDLLELGWVDLANLSCLVGELLVTNGHNALGSGILEVSIILQETLLVSTGLGVGDPDGLLGVVRLGLVRPLHLDVGEQELRGVGVHGTLDQLDMARHGESVVSTLPLVKLMSR